MAVKQLEHKKETKSHSSKEKPELDVVERIRLFNQDRKPELVQLKYHDMRQDVFSFFRGTCHLFYQDWPSQSKLNNAPATWICGDLHLENYGSYKADNRLVYFDMNDFDEAVLAPCTWEVARFLTSVIIGTRSFGLKTQVGLSLCSDFLEAYTDTLLKGHTRIIELKDATGMVKDLLVSLEKRQRKAFLDKLTVLSGRKRKIRLTDPKLQTVTTDEQAKVAGLLEKWAATQSNPDFYKLLDVAHRIAGTGSLGVERYILLVEGKGSPNANYLLDLKAETASSLQPYLKLPQPKWANQAARTVSVQKWMQGNPPALLAALEVDPSTTFVLKELQPMEDRINLAKYGKVRRLQKLVQNMGEVLAWNQMRSAGKQEAAIGSELIAFAGSAHWSKDLLDYAQTYSVQVEKDYRTFCAAYDVYHTGEMQQAEALAETAKS